MKIKALIIDDEPIAQDILEKYTQMVPELELVGKCDNALDASAFLQENEVDLMFLDIQMPEIDGLSFLKTLKTSPLVVLTTAFSEYAIESYELDVLDYLLKPISLDRFLKAVHRACDRMRESSNSVEENLQKDFIFLKDGHEQIKVLLDDILYCEGLKDYVQVHLTSGKKIVTLSTMKHMVEVLEHDKFLRVHRSYIVNLEKVESIIGNSFKIGGQLIGIGKSYLEEVKKLIAEKF